MTTNEFQNAAPKSLGRALGDRLLTVLCAAAMTFGVFLLLPIIQAINPPPKADTKLSQFDAGALPPPTPPPPEEEKVEEEIEPDDPPPELESQVQQMDISQINMMLDGGLGGGWGDGADFSLNLNLGGSSPDEVSTLFSLNDLDQKPRPKLTVNPEVNGTMKKKGPATVYVLCIVNEQGRVESPRIQSSPDPIFNRPALNAIKQWRFEPGMKNGKPVRFKCRQPITFPGS